MNVPRKSNVWFKEINCSGNNKIKITMLCLMSMIAACGSSQDIKIQPNATKCPVEHSLLTDNPGKVCLDLWGWQSSPFYQRVNSEVVSPEYMSKRAVDESYKWGANILEIYRGGYPLETREGWTKESTAVFHKHVHSRDMIIHWFSSAVNTDNLFGNQFDCLSTPAGELIDGMGSEQWVPMTASLFNKCVMPYSPFVYFYTDNDLFNTTLPNENDCSMSGSYGTDDQTGGYSRLRSELKKSGGLQFWGSQAECRAMFRRGFSIWANMAHYSGRGHPDWILKQINDQFRCRAIVRGSRNMSPSAIWWINESEYMCPDENRVYVYGCSQDPIKSAVTAKFTSLGEGWFLGTNATRLTQRYPYPSKAAFIQNNYLNLVLMPDKDEILLQNDPERVAHWDSNSHVIVVSTPFLKTISIADSSTSSSAEVTFKHVEPAGYKSVLRAEYKMKLNDTNVDETRTFTILNDSPYVRISIDRSVDNASATIGTEIPVKGYDQLITGGKTYTAESAVPTADIIRLVDSTRKSPELVLMLLNKGNLNEINWKPKDALILKSAPRGKSTKESITLAIVIPDGLYKAEEYFSLYKFINSPEETVTLDGEKEAEVKNQFDIPVVKVVKVQGGGDDPYQVYEFGRWVFRGAQVGEARMAQNENGYDYLKVYLPANGAAKINKYGFINDIAKVGWGCQYMVALKDVSRDGNKYSATAEVMDITSFIFAPRVMFKTPVASVRLNGKSWRYFEGKHVFLPNRRGDYKIEVTEGAATDASLARTFADIAESDFSNNKLVFTARLPMWTESIPEDYHFYAMVNHPGKAISSLDNAELCRKVDGKASVIRFKPGKITMGLSEVGSGKDMVMVDQTDDISKHLRKEQMFRTLPYLKSFDAKPVRLEDITSGKDNFDAYDVIVWNHFLQNKLPVVADKRLADILRSQVEKGKGLLLICNAMEIAPEILGERSRPPLEPVSASWVYLLSIGISASVDKAVHPIFNGLIPIKNGNDILSYALFIYKSYPDGTYYQFTRAKWKKEPESIARGTVLADFYADPKKGEKIPEKPAFAPGAVIREWTLGKGKIIGHYCGLRYNYGSIDKTIPTENAVRLIENAIKYLSGRKDSIKVAVVE